KEALAQRNAELEHALRRAEEQRKLATEARRAAEHNEQQARDAEERAMQLLKREQERAAWLQERLGSPVAEELRSEEHTSELQSRDNLVCRRLPGKKTRTWSAAAASWWRS